jgi:hypothetical protein
MFPDQFRQTRAEAISRTVRVIDLAPVRALLESLDDARYVVLAPRPDADASAVDCLRDLHELTGTLLGHGEAFANADVVVQTAAYKSAEPTRKQLLAVA